MNWQDMVSKKRPSRPPDRPYGTDLMCIGPVWGELIQRLAADMEAVSVTAGQNTQGLPITQIEEKFGRLNVRQRSPGSRPRQLRDEVASLVCSEEASSARVAEVTGPPSTQAPGALRGEQGASGVSAYRQIDKEFDLAAGEIRQLIRAIDAGGGFMPAERRGDFDYLTDSEIQRIADLVRDELRASCGGLQ